MDELTCPWCAFNKRGCGDKLTCDFRTLKYEKQAILDRMKEERKRIETFKDTMIGVVFGDEKDAEKMMNDVVDITVALGIMVERLKEDFGMNESEIFKEVKYSEGAVDVWVKKAKLVSALSRMKRRRGGKNNGHEESVKIFK